MVAREVELVICRLAAQRQAGGGDHKLDLSARINGHDPYAYLKDVLTRLSGQRASEIEQLLPHQWVSA